MGIQACFSNNNNALIMKTQAFFSNSSTDCRLQITYPDGHHLHVVFNSTAELVDYCKTNHIELTIADCHTED